MTQKAIGPNFGNELAGVGLLGNHFSWRPNGTVEFFDDTAPTVRAGVEAVYAAHDPTKPDPLQTYAAAIAVGIAIVSTSAPAINATYGIAPQDEINITGLQVAVGAGVFPGYYRDIMGTKRIMTGPQFTALATAALDYIAALDDARDSALAGGTPNWPTAATTVA